MESSSPAPERSLTCVKAHRKWVLMFIYSSIMHIQVFHNDSFMKNSLFQNNTTKKLSAETLKYSKYLKWFEECSSMASLPYSVKSYKGQQKQKQMFFVFFLQAHCFNSYSFLLFQSTTTKNVRLINVLSRYSFIPYQRLFCLTFKTDGLQACQVDLISSINLQ